MTKAKDKIMKMDFKKRIKQLLIAMVCVVLAGGGLSEMNGLLWLLAGLGGNLFAAVLFILVRSYIRRKCSVCGHYVSKNANYCTECGARQMAVGLLSYAVRSEPEMTLRRNR